MKPYPQIFKFQHTAARRRLAAYVEKNKQFFKVSTHSRPKAAGDPDGKDDPKKDVSTHSRPKAAGGAFSFYIGIHALFQHTAARRRLAI